MSCRWGFDELHKQLAEGKNAPETRYWLKWILFHCHYSMTPCGYSSKMKEGYGEGYGTGLPNNVDYSEIELRALRFLNES